MHWRLQRQNLIFCVGRPPQQGVPVGVGIGGAVGVVALAIALEQLYVEDACVCAAGVACIGSACLGACLQDCFVCRGLQGTPGTLAYIAVPSAWHSTNQLLCYLLEYRGCVETHAGAECNLILCLSLTYEPGAVLSLHLTQQQPLDHRIIHQHHPQPGGRQLHVHLQAGTRQRQQDMTCTLRMTVQTGKRLYVTLHLLSLCSLVYQQTC